MKPEPFVIKEQDWEDFVEQRTQAAYETLDNAIEDNEAVWKLLTALHLPKDIVAGGFIDYEAERFYMAERMAYRILDQTKAGILFADHELGHWHEVPGHSHPTTILKGLRHAHGCNFDSRSFTRFLRLRRYDGIRIASDRWQEEFRQAWDTGAVQSQSAPAK